MSNRRVATPGPGGYDYQEQSETPLANAARRPRTVVIAEQPGSHESPPKGTSDVTTSQDSLAVKIMATWYVEDSRAINNFDGSSQ